MSTDLVHGWALKFVYKWAETSSMVSTITRPWVGTNFMAHKIIYRWTQAPSSGGYKLCPWMVTNYVLGWPKHQIKDVKKLFTVLAFLPC